MGRENKSEYLVTFDNQISIDQTFVIQWTHTIYYYYIVLSTRSYHIMFNSVVAVQVELV